MRRSILLRTFAIVALTSVVMLLCIFSALYSHSRRALRAQSLEYTSESLQTARIYLDGMLNGLRLSMYQFVQNGFPANGGSEDAVTYFNIYATLDGDTSVRMLLDREGVLAISSPLLLTNARVDPSFYFTRASKNRIVTTEPYYSSLTASRTVAFIQSLPDSELLYVVEMRAASLFQTLIDNLSYGETLVALGAAGETVYLDPSSSVLRSLIARDGMIDLNDGTRRTLAGMETGAHEIILDGRDVIVKRLRYNQQWNLYFIVDAEQFYQSENMQMRRYTLYIMPAMLALMIACMAVSASVVRPIRDLKRQVDHLSPQQDGVMAVQSRRVDEIGGLAASFNSLLNRVRAADDARARVEAERYQMEYKVLQSQIQPHFLFNVHMCIDALLERGRACEARAMLADLDSLLRQSTDKTQSIVPLRQEMEMTGHYLSLQRIRMGDIFDVYVDDWQAYAQTGIPKLLLQPIVENAIYHGLTGIDRRGEIHISFGDIDELLYIIVEDNGRGIPANKLAALAQGEDLPPSQRGMVSIGFSNVRRRILSLFSKPCGLYISSREGLGTRIEIVVPLHTRAMAPEVSAGGNADGLT